MTSTPDSLAAQPAVCVKGIDLSGYMAKDARRAIQFYREVLGLEPSRLYPNDRGAEYDLPDGTTFGLWGAGGSIPFQPGNGILFTVEDLEEAESALNARNIPVLWRNETPNCSMLMIQDTEGNSLFLHRRKQ